MQAQVLPLRRYPALAKAAAAWFSEKWGLPQQSYRDSIRACLGRDTGVPQWYVVLDDSGGIAAGAGLIENDFHDRPDLCPNVCALYVERAYRGRGLARALLRCIREDAARLGITTLYLITEHAGFYETCGWQYCAMCIDDDGAPMRVYKAETRA